MTIYTDTIQQMYVAYFNRPADVSGLANWEAYAAGKSLADLKKAISTEFAKSAEYTIVFQGMTTSQIVTKVYQNLLGREPDAPGLINWINHLADGSSTISSLVTDIIRDAGAGDVDTLANKLSAAKSFTAALDTVAKINAYSGAAANKVAADWLATVGQTAASLTTATGNLAGTVSNVIDNSGANIGSTFTLTKGLDNLTGTAGNDTFIGSISGTSDLNTANALDTVNGGAGVDTLKISDDTGTAITLPTLSSVEVVEVSGTKAVTINSTGAAGVTNLNVVKTGGAVAATAGASTDVKVNLAQAAATANAAPTADVKADIAVNGGNNVTVNVTNVKQVLDVVADGSGELNGISVGVNAAAKGTVTVTSTGAASVAGTNATLSSVTVTGGTTVSVTQKATGDAGAAATDKVGATITQGAVTVNGNAATTTVTVKQDASAVAVAAVDAVAATASTQDVTFAAMTKGQTVTVDFGDGALTFTANKDLTAAEAASAFANLAKGVKQGNASAALGIYTDADGGGGKTGVTNGWTSGAVTSVSDTAAKVTFTSATAAAAITNGGGAVAVVAGAYSGNAVAAQAAVTGALGVANGVVTILDSNATGTIKTITVDGYANGSRIGGAGATDTTSLEALNLSNSGFGYTGKKVSSAAGITIDDTAATLALNLEKVGFSGYYNGDATRTTVAAGVTLSAAPTTLNVSSVGNNYVALTDSANAIDTLSVSGTGLLDISTNDLASLKTVKVTGSAGLKLNAGVADSVTSVDTTGTTGTVTISIQGDRATYTGGAGVDNVSITNASTAISKAIDLGAGDDRLDLSATDAIDPTVELKGGEGTDTLVLSAAAAAARSAAVTFQDKISGFERLEIGALAVAATVNLDNLDDINYVISKGAGGTKAVYDLDLTGLILNFDAVNGGDTLKIGGATVYTATVDGQGPAAALAGLPATVLIGGVTYDITKPGGNAVRLTAQTAANVAANVTMTVTDVSLDAAATAPTTATKAPTTNGVAAAAALLTLDKMLNNATVEFQAAGDVTVKLADATGSSDQVNLITKAATGTNIGTVTVNSVETIAVTAIDTDATKTAAGVDNVSANTLTLAANKAATIKVDGAGDLTLNLDATSTAVTLIDGSNATGKLTIVTLAGDLGATTVKGGSADDVLTAQGANDVLIGGAGKDTLKVVGTVASAVTLTGGDGIDAFDVSGFKAANAGAAATITDLAKGETIKFVADANANFASSKVTLIAEATFNDYTTEAAKAADAASGGDHGIAWFQFGGNTFIVQDVDGDAAFTNGTDIIVKITGLVDLSASSFNEVGQGTLLYI